MRPFLATIIAAASWLAAALAADNGAPRLLLEAELETALRTAYGPSGPTPEGLGYLQYTFGFLGPAALAARTTEWPELAHECAAIAWDRAAAFALSFRTGQPVLQSDVAGERDSHEGFARLTFATVPAERLGADRFCGDQHRGTLSPSPAYDGQRARALWAILLDRDRIAPAAARSSMRARALITFATAGRTPTTSGSRS